VALVVGGSAYAAGKINGRSIKANSIPLGKLTKQARERLAQAGPAGPVGPAGRRGPEGPAGERGPVGPTQHDYGVSALFVDGVKQPPLWTPTIPRDGNNAAVASGSAVLVGTEIPLDWAVGSGSLPAGTYIAQGTIEFFDFH
jgi:hypothetical protein